MSTSLPMICWCRRCKEAAGTSYAVCIRGWFTSEANLWLHISANFIVSSLLLGRLWLWKEESYSSTTESATAKIPTFFAVFCQMASNEVPPHQFWISRSNCIVACVNAGKEGKLAVWRRDKCLELKRAKKAFVGVEKLVADLKLRLRQE